MDSSGDAQMDSAGESVVRPGAPKRDGGAPPPNCSAPQCAKRIHSRDKKRFTPEGDLICQRCWDKQRRAQGVQQRVQYKQEDGGEISFRQHATRLTAATATADSQARRDGMKRTSTIQIRIAILIVGVSSMHSVDVCLLYRCSF